MDPLEIYNDLKEKIIWLELEPGRALNLEELAQSYQVSRNPVTIALTRLDAEDWVVRQGSHYVVSPLTLDRIREITEIRALLEVQANVWAMYRISSDQLHELKRFRQKLENLSDTISNKEIVKLDLKFHRLLFKASMNNQLAILLERMLNHYLRFWLSLPRQIDKETFFVEAKQIIEAIEAKDEARLRALTAEHIRVSVDQIMGVSASMYHSGASNG
ncbi:MAG: GntR family transcriptional regulator [Thermodesulfobacteriota bacterium]